MGKLLQKSKDLLYSSVCEKEIKDAIFSITWEKKHMYIRIKTVNLQNVNTKLKKLKFMIKIDDQGNFGIDNLENSACKLHMKTL